MTQTIRAFKITALLTAALLTGATSAAAAPSPRLQRPDDVVIEHVDVLPMTRGGGVLRDRTVVVRDGRIVQIAPSAQASPPADLPRLDGRDKWLMPALSDMHVHMEDEVRMRRMLGGQAPSPDALRTEDLLLPYVANGVLQVFNLSASSGSLAQRREVETGEALGPHIAAALLIDGDPPMSPGGVAWTATKPTPDEARAMVRAAKAAGYDAIKPYSALSLEAFSAIVDEARKAKLPVVGHIPLRGAGRTAELFQPGYGMVAHSEEYGYQTTPEVIEAEIPRFAALAKSRGVWLNTTIALSQRVLERTVQPDALKDRPELKYVHPYTAQSWLQLNNYPKTIERLPRRRKIVAFNPRLVRAFHNAGVPFVTGTDSLIAGVAPGFGLHDELEALARAGLPADAILQASTRRPAEWLGVAADRGTLEVGKRADLILLDADPLADVANTRHIAAVISGGRVYPREELDRLMQELAARYAAMPVPALAPARPGGQMDDHED